ncbi:unnamed protein product [Nyctereutes procyonoides]|uniref:(raccoon dog) hypothetical protein n=1 Tax=Nyctereutes procyonoides TaxID=34880 RepID=A0A811ZKI0_NYCPR|nr:unnamed protein product [Nyctereutes procyonoides]
MTFEQHLEDIIKNPSIVGNNGNMMIQKHDSITGAVHKMAS